MQKISDKELLLQLTGIYEVLDGFRATMNGYYDMKDENYGSFPFGID